MYTGVSQDDLLAATGQGYGTRSVSEGKEEAATAPICQVKPVLYFSTRVHENYVAPHSGNHHIYLIARVMEAYASGL